MSMNVAQEDDPQDTANPHEREEVVARTLGARDRAVRGQAIEDASKTVDPDILIKAVADHENSRRRNDAMEALVRGGSRSVPALIRALRQPDPEAVMFAAAMLARLRETSSVPRLALLLDHPDVNVVQQAVESLAQLRSRAATAPLIKVLERDQPWLRFSAVHALGEIGGDRAVDALGKWLDDELLRVPVIEALGKIASEAALRHLCRLLRENAGTELFPVCVRALAGALRAWPREESLRSLPEFAELASVAELRERLTEVLFSYATEEEPLDGSRVEVAQAIAALVRAVRLEPVYPSLVLLGGCAALEPVVEYSAACIGEGIIASLEDGLGVEAPEVRLNACRCLGALGRRESAAKIEALLGDPHPAVRLAAVDTLVALGRDEAAAAIVGCLSDSEPVVREAATRALGRLDTQLVSSALLPSCENGKIGAEVALAVMSANPHADQIGFAKRCLESASGGVRRAAVLAIAAQPSIDPVGMLEPLLRDPEVSVRRAAIGALGKVRTARVRKLLLGQIEWDHDSRIEALWALGEFGDNTALRHLVDTFSRESTPGRLAVIEVLGELRDRTSEPFLVRLLGDANPEIRRAAVSALKRFPSTTALAYMAEAARDPEPTVRAAVADALATRDTTVAREALERLSVDLNAKVASTARRHLQVLEARDAAPQL